MASADKKQLDAHAGAAALQGGTRIYGHRHIRGLQARKHINHRSCELIDQQTSHSRVSVDQGFTLQRTADKHPRIPIGQRVRRPQKAVDHSPVSTQIRALP